MQSMAQAASHPPQSRPKKTLEDFMALGDETRVEMIAGEFYMAPAPFVPHQDVAANLHILLAAHVRPRGLGVVVIAPMDVHLLNGDIVQPDLLFIAKDNMGIVKGWIYGVPNLAIEIISPSHPERDRFVKRSLYARNGMPEYWIVDPAEQTIEVLRLAGEAFEPAGYFGVGTVLKTAALPTLDLPVDDVFERHLRAPDQPS